MKTEIDIIDEFFVMFDGIKFRKDTRSGYYWTVTVPRKSLHLSVFEFYGNIRSDGYELHHVDFNKENNDIENIICLTKDDHKKLHTEHRKKEYGKDWNKENILKAQKGVKEWRKTKDYKNWLIETKENRVKKGKESHKNRKKINLKCQICGNTFGGYEDLSNVRKHLLCSNKCKAKFRRDSGVDNVEKKCIICDKKFISNKNQKIKTCSTNCRATLGYSNRSKGKKNNI